MRRAGSSEAEILQKRSSASSKSSRLENFSGAKRLSAGAPNLKALLKPDPPPAQPAAQRVSCINTNSCNKTVVGEKL